MKIDLSQYEKLLHEGKLDRVIRGQHGVKGISIGYARVGPNPKSIKDIIEEGDIAVVPLVTPADPPYLIECGGIVTDTGGKANHAAMLANDLSIPCTIGARDATKTLANYTGKLLLYVDHYIGLVYKVKEV